MTGRRHLAPVPGRRARPHARSRHGVPAAVRRASSTPRSAPSLTSTGAREAAASSPGDIDEARIWNVARSAAQIAAEPVRRDHQRHGPDRPLRPQRGLRHASSATPSGTPNGTTVGTPDLGRRLPARRPHAACSAGGLSPRPGNHFVALSWTANGEADLAGYSVYRGTTTPVPTTGTPLNGATLLTPPSYTDTTARQRHDVPLRRRGGRQRGQRLAGVQRRRRDADRGRGLGAAVQRHQPVRDLRRGAGLGALDVHARDLVQAHRRRRRVTTGNGGIASAIPLVTKGGAETEALATST